MKVYLVVDLKEIKPNWLRVFSTLEQAQKYALTLEEKGTDTDGIYHFRLFSKEVEEVKT